ncbi:MAG: hypothetical protein P1U87_07875 [Verrucomicrobiales bacterium]|nr:hypothetical protein [Verrucomicrobiales bacterium]
MANGFPNLPLSFLWYFTPVLLICFAIPCPGEEEKARKIGYLFEGSFESPEIFQLPEGAKITILVPYYEWDYGVRAFTKEAWDERSMTQERFAKAAATVADQLAESVKLDVVRDKNEVVEYILIEDKSPFVTSILTSDKLLPRVKDLLGDKILVVMIDRNLLFLFPSVGGNLKRYGPSLVADFNAAKLPISLEVFVLDEEGFRAIGVLNREQGLIE